MVPAGPSLFTEHLPLVITSQIYLELANEFPDKSFPAATEAQPTR